MYTMINDLFTGVYQREEGWWNVMLSVMKKVPGGKYNQENKSTNLDSSTHSSCPAVAQSLPKMIATIA